ncbi:MAG: hypothetical protein PHY47_21230 [Lachnospiraceae bacterium]|nr:hypothetical protein [Lachnospiraceae bacterium]
MYSTFLLVNGTNGAFDQFVLENFKVFRLAGLVMSYETGKEKGCVHENELTAAEVLCL